MIPDRSVSIVENQGMSKKNTSRNKEKLARSILQNPKKLLQASLLPPVKLSSDVSSPALLLPFKLASILYC
jgi:hypothetical protein